MLRNRFDCDSEQQLAAGHRAWSQVPISSESVEAALSRHPHVTRAVGDRKHGYGSAAPIRQGRR
ncbi:hypothetical protein [Rhodococcus marinonascens]|uniref:hypothetical protein n=1 Tax=Rhodococcus marinonascens TaxID=38311 RepID=UPI0009342FCE|nr:hypothetical protein [Rhodococcus marinonascens]